jgi:hypothetical protein
MTHNPDPAADLAERARRYAPDIIDELARLALNAEADATRVAAGNALLDRGYGKPTAHVEAYVAPACLSDDVEIARRLIFILRRGEAALDDAAALPSPEAGGEP